MDKENVSYIDRMKQQQEENLAYLQSLNIAKVFNPMIKHDQEKRRQIAEYKAAKRKREEEIVPRRSQRLLNMPPPDYTRDFKLIQAVPEELERKKKLTGPLDFSGTVFHEEQIPSDLSTCFKAVAEGKFEASRHSAYKIYHDKFKSMKISEHLVAKLGMTKITSIAVHPSPSPILVCSGSSSGEIGFWNITSKAMKSHMCIFKPHADRVSCLAFAPEDNSKMYSTSFDGSVRCSDLQSLVFEEVYESVDSMCTSFDFISPSTLLVSQRDDGVVVVDMRNRRTKDTTVEPHQTHDSTVRTVSIHPVQRNYFIVSGKNGLVNLWDLRKLKKSVTDIPHYKSVHGAYFSPVTGNSILTTCTDNNLRVFDSSNLKNIDLKCLIRHNNFTGRWLTPFKAVWLPNDEQTFVVGSMLQPRRIEVYDVTGKIVHNFHGDYLASVCSINAFHVSEPVLAGGNSSGRIHVFMKS